MAEARPDNQPADGVTTVFLDATEQNYGRMLTNLRIKRNLSMQEVAASCRITVGTLQDLESGDPMRMDQSNVFIASMIETLCRKYDQMPDEILECFYRAYGECHPERGDDSGFNLSDRDIRQRASRLSSRIIGVFALLLFLLIIGAWGYTAYQRSRQQAASANYDLPSLLPTPDFPMEVLPIPKS